LGEILTRYIDLYIERPEMIKETNYEFSIKDHPRLYVLATDVQLQRIDKWSFGPELLTVNLYHLDQSELDLAQQAVVDRGLVEPDPIYTEIVEYNCSPESQLTWSEQDECTIVIPIVLDESLKPEIKVTKVLTWLPTSNFNYH
jgi:hypothetical protein